MHGNTTTEFNMMKGDSQIDLLGHNGANAMIVVEDGGMMKEDIYLETGSMEFDNEDKEDKVFFG